MSLKTIFKNIFKKKESLSLDKKEVKFIEPYDLEKSKEKEAEAEKKENELPHPVENGE